MLGDAVKIVPGILAWRNDDTGWDDPSWNPLLFVAMYEDDHISYAGRTALMLTNDGTLLIRTVRWVTRHYKP